MISYDKNNNTIIKVKNFPLSFKIRDSNGWTISTTYSSSTHQLSSCRVKTSILESLLANICSVDPHSGRHQTTKSKTLHTEIFNIQYSSCWNTENKSKQSQEPLAIFHLKLQLIVLCSRACSFFYLFFFFFFGCWVGRNRY